MPEICPDEDIDKPAGSPVAVKLSVSESGSEKAWVTEKPTCDDAMVVLFSKDEKTGCRLRKKKPGLVPWL